MLVSPFFRFPLTFIFFFLVLQVGVLGEKKWSPIGGKEPNYLTQNPNFQQEFPKLTTGGDTSALSTKANSAAETQYGTRPVLRPQTEGSWSQGGAGGRLTGAGGSQNTHAPAQGPHQSLSDMHGMRNSSGPTGGTGAQVGQASSVAPTLAGPEPFKAMYPSFVSSPVLPSASYAIPTPFQKLVVLALNG